MTCDTCGSAYLPGQKFCASCGTALTRSCPSCGTPTQPGQRFCAECGTALTGGDGRTPTSAAATPAGATAASRDRPEPIAERRLVSILFADLVGFTTFAESRDAEDVRETLSRYFDLASDVIGRYGGTVEKFIGDAVMAVWGAPTAREDDAERAVRAGMELVDAVRGLGPSIQARAGVLTGEAAVTLGATNQGMVAGDLVNTASRLQSVAPVGTVLVGEATFRASSRAIAFEPAGEQVLKGKEAPVPAWRAMRVVAEVGGRGRSEALEAPFVGRDDDLRLIKDLFHTTERDRRLRLVSIVGTGGIGKSRLGWEFEKYLDGIVGRVWWHHGRSPAYGQGITFWALGEMIRARAKLAETDDEATTRAGVEAMLATYLPDDPDRDWVERALLELLGVRTDLPSGELFGAWRRFFERMSDSGPVVLVFQDLHWADPGTLDFIDHLLEWSRGAGIFIVTLARPELLEKRPDWGAGQRSFTSIHLDPLPDDAMAELLDGLIPGLPDPTRRAIIERAEGIPLYAVETVRMLVASGQLVPDDEGVLRATGDLSEMAVPETLTALIAARLDGLDGDDRGLLLDAAVLGQSFTPAGLAAISGADPGALEPRLRSLVRREMLTHVADPRSPERGQYAFVQALIREVAYNTLSKKDRKVRHLAAARWFESLGEEELAGALAGHYLSARDNASDDGEAEALAIQARIALKAAGERAAALGSHEQAIAFFEQALSVATDPTEQADLLERAGDSAATWGQYDDADRSYVAAIERIRAIGDRPRTAAVIGKQGTMLSMGRRMERAVSILEAAATEFADLTDDPGLLTVVSQLARAHMMSGDNDRAIVLADQVLPAAERLDLLGILADTLVTKGTAYGAIGRFREGRVVIEAGERLAEQIGSTFIQLRALHNTLSWTSEVDPAASIDDYRAAISLASRLGQRQWVSGLIGNLGWSAIRTGDWALVISTMDEALAEPYDDSDRVAFFGTRALARLLRGEPYAADVEATAETAAAAGDPTLQIGVAEVHAWIDWLAGRFEAARDRLLPLAEDPSNVAQASFGITARLALWLGDSTTARRESELFYAQMPHSGVVEATRDALLAGVEALEGNRERAVALYRSASRATRDLRVAFDEALLGIDMVHTLGPDDPVAHEAAANAREILTRLGSAPLLAILDAAEGAAGRTTATPTRTPVDQDVSAGSRP